MRDRCEICSSISDLTEVYERACDENSPSATLCGKCKKKYFDYLLPDIFGFSWRIPKLPYVRTLTLAENLVLKYKTKDIKETDTMQVTYNGFTGDLVKLEREEPITITCISGNPSHFEYKYAFSIYDNEKKVTHSFTGVKLEDVKFLGGAVTFGS